MKLAVILLSLFIACPSSSWASKETSQPISASVAQEIAVGQQIHSTILSSFYPYTDPQVVSYVEEVGEGLIKHCERREIPYQFTVLYNDKIYATSAPGGFIYITTGMLFFLENESQLAAVLAHEIGELQEKEPSTKDRRTISNVARAGAMVAPLFGPFGILASLGLVAIHQASQPKPPKTDEKLMRADKRALQYMLEAQQDPQGMIDVLYKFLNAKKEITPYFYDYYQSRPITMERFNAVQKEFSKLSIRERDFETNWQGYQSVTKGIREIYKQ